MRGVASLEELCEAFVHFLYAALLSSLARAAVSHDVVHVGIDLLGGQLNILDTLGEVLKFPLPTLDHYV